MLVARYRGREGIPVHSLVNKRCGASAPVAATLVTCAGTRGPPSLVGTPRDLTGGRLDPGTRVRAKRRGKSIRSPRGHRSLRHPPLLKHRKKLGDLPLTPSFQQRPRRVLGPPRAGDDAGKCHLADFPPADASNFYYISLANPSCPWIIHLRVACIGNADLLGAEWKEKGGPNTGAGGRGRERQSAMCADMFD